MVVCCYPDFNCTAPTVDGTYYCRLHLGVMRARKAADLFGAAPEPEPHESTDAEREASGQIVFLDAYRTAQREGTAA